MFGILTLFVSCSVVTLPLAGLGAFVAHRVDKKWKPWFWGLWCGSVLIASVFISLWGFVTRPAIIRPSTP